MRAFALVGVLCLAACAPGKSVATITVTAASMIPVAKIKANVSDASGHMGEVDVSGPTGGTISPDYVFSLRFDASVKGAVHIDLETDDASGMKTASGSGDLKVSPSGTTTTTIMLTPATGSDTLAFATQPQNALVNAKLAPITVQLLDANLMLDAASSANVTLALATNPSSATLGGTLTVAAIGGIATFSDLTLDKTGTYTLSASATGLATVTSASFMIESTGWVQRATGLSGGDITDIVLDPKHAATLYATTTFTGVWKSIDSGATWAHTSSGLPARMPVDTIAIDPNTTTTLWAGLGALGIYLSTDGGATWTQSYNGVINAGASASIAVDPSHAGHIYAAGAKLVAYTTNGGTSWNTFVSGATYGSGPRSIAVHPTTGDVWLAQFGDGLWKVPFNTTAPTLADGTTNMIPGTHPYMKCVAFNVFDPTTMYATGDISPTIYVSSDGGANWVAAAAAPVHAPIRMRGYIMGGGTTRTYGAVPEEGIVSNPTGNTQFNYNSAGITGAVGVAVDPTTNQLVYAATADGVFRTTDAFNFSGRYTGLIARGTNGLALDTASTQKVYVATTLGIFRSTDAAQSWSAASSAMPGSVNISSVAVDHTNDQNLFLGTSNWSWQSTDVGANWSSVTDGGAFVQPIVSLASSPGTAGTFYAGGAMGLAWSFATGSATWASAASGLPTTSSIAALAVHPTDAMQVYAGTSQDGVYRTANGGASWTVASTGLGGTHVTGLAIDPMTPMTLYASTSDASVWKSTDGGGSWSAAATGLPTAASAIAVAPSMTSTIYAATSSGIFQSLDSGATWTAFNTGLLSTDISGLAVDPADAKNVFAASWDQGVWQTVTQ